MTARMKSLKIFPLPILLYEIALLMDWLGEPGAARMYSSFVEAQSRFTADDIQDIFFGRCDGMSMLLFHVRAIDLA